MRIVGKGVEEQVTEGKTREVVVVARSIHEDEPCRLDAASLGFAAQASLRRCTGRQQPENAALNRMQQPHPNIEYFRHDLLVIIETAEHKPSIGQACLGPTRNMMGPPPGIIDLIAARELHNLLRKEGLILEWQHELVAEDIVHEGSARRSRISQVVDLNRGGAMSED